LLLVEDEIELGQTIAMALMKMGLDCTWVKTIREARVSLAEKIFDLVILDRNLPDGEGTVLLDHPKRSQFCVLILSSKSSVDQRVEGLKRGADDYLPKPFSFKELEARIQALLRRRPVSSQSPSGARPLWTLSEENMNLSCENGIVDLTPLEFKFMKYLLDKKGQIVSKDRLLKDVWGFSFLPKTRTVDYLVNQLRKRIEVDPESPKHLLTIRGAGVKFVP
jgi:two-component system alkaline phosphatase synthesis response regulator PhoP